MLTAAGLESVMRSRYAATLRCTAAPTSGVETPQRTQRCSSISSPSTRMPLRTPSTIRATPSTSRAASAAQRATTSGETTASATSALELLQDGRDRHDVALELQRRVGQAGGHADQLREGEDRHREVAPRRGLQLRLPGVEREVAEGARRDDRVGSCLRRLLDRLDE